MTIGPSRSAALQTNFTTGFKDIRVATTTTGANMRYTINGPPPTSTSGTLIASWSGTVRLTPSPAGTTLRVIAFKAGMNDSEVNSGTYYYESGNMPQPVDEGGSGQPDYDDNGNLIAYKDSTYTYDAQNRLIRADKNSTGTHVHYYYDGLNRRIAASDSSGNVTVNVWDGWNLIEERTSGNGLIYSYISGAGTDEMVRRTGGTTTLWYYQDGRGNTSHLANDSGGLLERYTYDYAGNTRILSTNNTQLSTSAFNNRFLFQGRDYSSELGLYDYRNRIYFPSWGRFLQTDASGFQGDSNNLYRHCGNDPVNAKDPTGLDVERGSHPWLIFPHEYIGIDDWTLAGGGMRYFDFGSENGGRWSDHTSVPSDYTVSVDSRGLTMFWSTNPAQDLVLINAYYLAQDHPQTYYPWPGYECGGRIEEVFHNALGPEGWRFNPVDPYTGNIFDAQWNYVGWQDPDTGNLYDADGDWAGWNPNWNSGSGGGRTIGAYGTADGYGGGNFVSVGPNGFGGLGTGFGGQAGGFIYGIGGQGYGGVGNNSRGVTVTKLNLGKKPH